jgi:predicted phage tail protein
MALPKPVRRAVRRRQRAEGWVRTIASAVLLVSWFWFVANVGVAAVVGILRFVLAATGWL